MVSGHICEQHEIPHSCLNNLKKKKKKAGQSEGSQLFLDPSEN